MSKWHSQIRIVCSFLPLRDSLNIQNSWHKNCIAIQTWNFFGAGSVMKYESVIRKVSEAVARRAKPVDLTSLSNLGALTKNFGFDRGQPVDRFFISHFLKANIDIINGDILEVAERRYSSVLSTNDAKKWILNYSADEHAVDTSVLSINGDLTKKETLPESSFDCFICTQTLNCIYDLKEAVKTIKSLLRPGGVALITLPSLTQLSGYDSERWGDFWRFTPASAERLFSDVFSEAGASVKVSAYGNLLAAITLLRGAAVEDLPHSDALLNFDPEYPVVTCVKVKKAEPN